MYRRTFELVSLWLHEGTSHPSSLSLAETSIPVSLEELNPTEHVNMMGRGVITGEAGNRVKRCCPFDDKPAAWKVT